MINGIKGFGQIEIDSDHIYLSSNHFFILSITSIKANVVECNFYNRIGTHNNFMFIQNFHEFMM